MNFRILLFFLCELLLISSILSQRGNNTLQLCCEPAEYFNANRYICEKLPNDVVINWKLKINYPNETEGDVNVLENIIHKVNLPCDKPEVLHWKINETIDVNLATNAEFCWTPFPLEGTEKYVLAQLDCHLELHYFLAFKHEYIYFFSDFLLIPTLIVYALLKPLNSNLMGKSFMCYLISVIFTSCVYFTIPKMLLFKYRFPNLVYILMAFFHFYFNMAMVYWMNVLGMDAWKKFSGPYDEPSSLEKSKRFCYYSLYAWGMGVIAAIPTVWRNSETIFDYCHKYKQSKSCVMSTYAILYEDIYFAPAVMIILVINFLIVCSISWKVYTTRVSPAFAEKLTVTFPTGDLGQFDVDNHKNFNVDANLNIGGTALDLGGDFSSKICLRLFVLMGPQWIIIYILKDYRHIEILIVIMNYVHSLLTFVLFILRKKVLNMLFER